MSFKIHLSPSTFSSSGASVIGEIWFEIDGTAFPGEGWSDFIDPAFTTWLREAFRVAQGVTGSSQLTFMDGPYEARFRVQGGETVYIRISGAHSEFTVRRQEFALELLRATTRLESGFEMLGLDSSEWKRYKSALKACTEAALSEKRQLNPELESTPFENPQN